MKKKKTIILIIILTAIVIITSSAIAYLTSVRSKTNTIQIGTVVIDVHDLQLNQGENQVNAISPGDIDTITWTSENTGTAAVLTKHALEIYLESGLGEEHVNKLALYPSNMSNSDILADFKSTSEDSSRITTEPITKEVNNKTIYGVKYTFVGNTLNGTVETNVAESTSQNCSLKLLLDPSVSYLFQNEPISVKVTTTAIQQSANSEWSNNPVGFSSSDFEVAQASVRKINVVPTENIEWQENEDPYGIEKNDKVVVGEPTEELDSYVRIRCIPIVQYFDSEANNGTGDWYTAPIPQDKILLTIAGTDWTKSGDYWYYHNILKGKSQIESLTENLNIQWELIEIPSELAEKHIRTNVRVILEYAQADNDVWKSVFGIDSIP